ncbi:YMGG-like glycine zipper-containing protein [Bosea sp. (in: a-proteobacteria)]|uniref:YMGG-like glycine zipper-containing protein n=1 Tax=Bosea sp. (in: a-proteobacteria) TaxID=1871050 RepID=UPI00261079FD|nr:YMGG-like glycine zipper-containing protein [Bosea sp. (in: a-proteobacteria)]MCO5091065.1 YMGG-like glycine zipper-containing protein [Bosea sp. (in: a-proteobacteria)]
MRLKITLVAIGLALAGCNTNSADQRTLGGAAIGAGGGAIIGGIAGGGRGAAIGAGVGAVSGAIIGRATTPNNCIYRDRYGRKFTARCP